MNTCNYLTPFPLATHVEGGVLYSNGVQVVTISNPNLMKVPEPISWILAVPILFVAGCAFVYSVIYIIFKK